MKNHFSALFVVVAVMASGCSAKTSDLENQLYHAVVDCSTGEVKRSVEQGADINRKHENYITILHFAAMVSPCPETIEVLIEEGADIHAEDANGLSPLYYSVLFGRAGNIEALVAAGADIDEKDINGGTLLHYAFDPEVVQVLLGFGANVNAKSAYGQTPLHIMLTPEIPQFLMSAMKELDSTGDPVFEEVEIPTKLSESAIVLIEAGADVNARDAAGNTPLHLSAKKTNLWDESSNALASAKRYRVVAALIEAGADVDAVDNQGRTPLDIAKMHENSDVVRILEKHAR